MLGKKSSPLIGRPIVYSNPKNKSHKAQGKAGLHRPAVPV